MLFLAFLPIQLYAQGGRFLSGAAAFLFVVQQNS